MSSAISDPIGQYNLTVVRMLVSVCDGLSSVPNISLTHEIFIISLNVDSILP